MEQGTHSSKHWFWRGLEFFIDLLGGVLMIAATVVLFSAVLFRYALHSPLGWTDEVSRIVFMWITFLGAAVCCANEIHTRFDLFMKKVKPLTNAVLHALGIVLILILSAVYVVYGIRGASRISYERFIILDVPYAVGYVALPVAAILIILFYLRNLYVQVKRVRYILKHGEDVPRHHQSGDIDEDMHEPLV